MRGASAFLLLQTTNCFAMCRKYDDTIPIGPAALWSTRSLVCVQSFLFPGVILGGVSRTQKARSPRLRLQSLQRLFLLSRASGDARRRVYDALKSDRAAL